MTNPLRKLLTVVLISLAALVILVSFSVFRAYRISQSHIRNTLPPPLYSIQFALHPNCYIDGDREFGFKPGWIVTYAPRSKNYGTGVLVSLFGSILGSGTPTIVTKVHENAEDDIGKFKQAFAQVDAAIEVGMTFSNAAGILRVPPALMTNDDGTLVAFYTFRPRAMEHTAVDWLTNGITLHISNGIVIHKTYSYTSSR
jgi:hypothetical protein